ASPNFNLRDPVMYRVLHQAHHNTGAEWCIYPMYDWAHGIEDGLERVTHSVCTLEFENHRPLYDWFIEAINDGRAPADRLWHSRQIEFAKLQFTYTVLSKRNMRRMVEEGFVKGWDDPRMPTLSAMRRRGYPAAALRAMCEEVGVTKVESLIDVGRLENAVRHGLNRTAPRAMCVLRPLRVVIENWPAGKVDELDFVINPEDPSAGTRKVRFTGELFVEREDFMEVPEKKFFRLAPGVEVRLRWAYFIKCVGVDKDAAGNITAVRCTYDAETRGGDAPPGPDGKPSRKVKGTLHWLSASEAVTGEVRLFERLFSAEAPGEKTGKWEDDVNPCSLEVLMDAKIDPALRGAKAGEVFQFERLGYFCVDPDSKPGAPVFNRTVTLKESK
ncbi:MAG: glutamine--tRNA ligase, partial [Phycisphaerales bacterium]|nr:glutamine--tRNA ligase [Phycisphaerales bacterium]